MSEEQEPTPPPTPSAAPSEVPPPAPQDTPPPTPVSPPVTPAPVQGQVPGADKKILAGLLAIFLGAFGVHKFILGYQKEGITMAVIGGVCFVAQFVIPCLPTLGLMAVGIIGLIEGIIYLTKSDEEFVNTYITNQKPWF